MSTDITRPEIRPPVAKAIDEQRNRLWRLRSLIEVTAFAVDHESGDEIEDLNAVLAGLLELADSIHEALETQTIAERAAELAEDAAQREVFTGDAS